MVIYPNGIHIIKNKCILSKKSKLIPVHGPKLVELDTSTEKRPVIIQVDTMVDLKYIKL